MAESLAEELEWYADADERVISAIFRDLTDGDYCFVLLARDETRKFRAIDVKCNFRTMQEAWAEMKTQLEAEAAKENPGFNQGSHLPGGLDLFAPIVADERRHRSFRVLMESPGHSPARGMIQEMMPHLEDVDGNFVEQFQSTGFDARLWELYLFAYFREERLQVTRPQPAPDFRVERFGQVAFVEAVIAGPTPGAKTGVDGGVLDTLPKDAAELRKRLDNEIPIRFGSPLFTKLKKEYWTHEHVGTAPLVIAIADFHAEGSMTWTSTALIEYLYGTRHDFSRDDDGNLVISPLRIETHRLGRKEIPSGFFFLPSAENVSAVLFSNSGTISKFTRMGKLAEFGDPRITVIRTGTRYHHDPNAALPLPFSVVVDRREYQETWGQGLSVYHNPRAIRPLPEELFPSVAHHRFDEGLIRSHIPEFHPFASWTQIFVPEEEKPKAR